MALPHQACLVANIDEWHALPKQIHVLGKQKCQHHQCIFGEKEALMAKQDKPSGKMETIMHQRTIVEPLFTIHWSLV